MTNLSASTPPTVDDLKALQNRLDYGDQHVVWVGPSSYVVAHTDQERVDMFLGGRRLEACSLHRWLHGLSGPPPCGPGYYLVFPDAPDSWEFHPLGDEVQDDA